MPGNAQSGRRTDARDAIEETLDQAFASGRYYEARRIAAVLQRELQTIKPTSEPLNAA